MVHERDNNSIGRITTGGAVSNYTGTDISGPNGITAGPDGALWFTNVGNSSIGRITTGGAVSNCSGTGISNPAGITAGPGRRFVVRKLRVWHTPLPSYLHRADHDGRGRSNYTGTGISQPDGITAGPDGALWFTNANNSTIGRITTGGAVSNYIGTGIALRSGSRPVRTAHCGSQTTVTPPSGGSRREGSSPTTPEPA